jgi:hypothetical protein
LCIIFLDAIEYGIFKPLLNIFQGPSSSDLESILSPDPIYSDLQLKEINYNAAGDTLGFPSL